MKYAILAFGQGSVEETAQLKMQSEFRKATLKMQVASLSISKALVNSEAWKLAPSEMGFVLNSGYGEIESTAEFLETLSSTGVARPVLFQNSLHNSTTGFAAIRFKISGPVFTVNHRAFGGEQALVTAQSLLADQECKICLVTTLETVPKQFVDEKAGTNSTGEQGAMTLALADAEWARASGLNVLAELISVEAKPSSVSENIGTEHVFQSLYGFDSIQKIGQELAAGHTLRGGWVVEKQPFGRARLVWA